MANSDETAPYGGQAQDQQAAAQGPAVCGAEELKGLLQHIAERISDTDRRHTSALEQMQVRLAALGEEARQVRHRVPAEYIPAFDRVEEGLGMLAERIHHTATQPRRAAAPEVAPEAAAVAPAPSPEETAARAAAEAAARVEAQIARDAEQMIAAAAAAAAPMPLRSAVSGSAPVQAAIAHGIDPFDLVDRDNPEPAEAWDPASAEALSRIYETSEPGFMRRMPDPDADAAPAAAVQSAAAARGLEIERDWLEGRFADIARRVEQSLAEARPDNSLLTLGERFDTFEQRFGSVLGDVATRADVEGLRLVEAHINELAQHFEHAQTQLARLDMIESQLHAVVDRLSDRRFVDMMENAGAPPAGIEALVEDAAARAMQRFAGSQQPAAPHPAPNFDRLAQLAAEQAVSRMSSTLQQLVPAPAPVAAAAADEARVGELRNMIEGFITERRHGEEHTATMLDTMQQAMIRVLDRIDAMELAQHHAQQQAAAAPQEYVREQVRFNMAPSDMGGSRSVVDDARHAAEAAVAAANQMPQRHGGGPDLPSGPVRMIGEENERIEPSLRGGRVLDEQTKDDFVAAARRARQKVASSQRPDAAPGSLPTPKAGDRPGGPDTASRAAAPAGKPGKPMVDKAKDVGASFFGIPRKALLGGAVAVLALMIAAVLGPMKRGEPGRAVIGAASPVQTTAPVATAQSSREPAVDVPPTTDNQAADAQSGEPKPAMDFTPRKFDGLKADETEGADVRKMSATAETTDDAAAGTIGSDRANVSVDQPMGGISLQHSDRTPTPQDLDRLEQQQRVASLSSELGAAAVSPAAHVVEQQLGAAADALAEQGASAASGGRSSLDLPPATVGPLSLRLAAARGDASAEFEVGARLAEGKGTNQNFAEAVKWYQRSAQRGFAQSQYRLGTLYERGLGVKNDLARARVWYKRAAEQGNVKSMHNLAVLSAGRQAGSPDYATAAQWFAEAADRGLADSQFNLAVLYESGLGVPKDNAQAFKWLTIAARSGDRETVKRRDAMRSRLGAGELEKAEAMIRDWQAKPTELMSNDARAAGEAWKQSPAAATEGNG